MSSSSKVTSELMPLFKSQQNLNYDSTVYEQDKDIDKKSLDDIPPLSTDLNVRSGLLSLFRKNKVNGDNIATQPSVFDSSEGIHFYPQQSYENYHRFDPKFRWTWKEQWHSNKKSDFFILLWCMVMFFVLDIDRSNITNANAGNFLEDLKLSQSDYNLGQTLSKLGFLIAELPSQLISKKVGPDRWIPIQIVIFSIISFSQFWLNGRNSFLATRFLIAFFQGGFIPDIILYLSYFYTKAELPIRMAFFYTINPFADLITAFLGVGLLKMDGIRGYSGWRWMFLIEGLFTLIIGIISFKMMKPSPTKTNGLFTEHEEYIITNKILRDDPGKSSMHNRQMLTPKMLWKSLTDPYILPMYLLAFTFNLPSYPVKNYLQLSFKSLGFNTEMSNLLTVPYIVISILTVLGITAISELVRDRGIISISQSIWMLPCFIALVALAKTTTNTASDPWTYFAILTVLLGYPNVQPIMISWTSANSGSVSNRTVSASVFNMSVQISAIAGSNVYQSGDKNNIKGNSAMVAICVLNIILFPLTKLFYMYQNRKRGQIWNKMSEEEKDEYYKTTKDEGNKL